MGAPSATETPSRGRPAFPFTALEGQPRLARALALLAVNPRLRGLLVQGERGSGKSTAARALAALLPARTVFADCPFGCLPERPASHCAACRARPASPPPALASRPAPFVTLPLGATEDQVAGTFDLERALTAGERRFSPGLLARAHGGVLYVDEVNLLEDHLVDLLLDAAATGVNEVAREGLQLAHPAEILLVGTMNPEEGDLRPQLTDRFGLSVTLEPVTDVAVRALIVERALSFEDDPAAFAARFAPAQAALAARLAAARARLPRVALPAALRERAASLSVSLGVPGHRGDLLLVRAAATLAALEERDAVSDADLWLAAELALPHRLPSELLAEDAETALGRIHAALRGLGLEAPPAPPDAATPEAAPPRSGTAEKKSPAIP